jgi:hypothetical protein
MSTEISWLPNSQSIKDCLYLIKFALRCLYIEDDNRFMFLTEIKNVGKPNVEIDVKYSERDRTVRYGLLAISALSYVYRKTFNWKKYLHENWLILVIQTKVNNLSIAIVHFSVYLFLIDILKFSKRIDVYWILLYSLFYNFNIRFTYIFNFS